MTDPQKQESPIRLTGQLLLADPSLRDGIFNRSVVLLGDHSADDGAFGLILNRPSGGNVGDYLTDEEFAPLSRVAVHLGGPVSPQQLIFAALWWSADSKLRFATRISTEDAVDHIKNPGTLVRAFVGYSGWSEGQLEGELRQKSWITAAPNSDLLSQSHDDSLWASTLRSISPYHKVIAESPEDPLLN